MRPVLWASQRSPVNFANSFLRNSGPSREAYTVSTGSRCGFRRVAVAPGRARMEVEGVMTEGGVDGSIR